MSVALGEQLWILSEAIRKIESGNPEAARRELKDLVKRLDIEGSSDDQLGFLMASALDRRAQGGEHAGELNLYLCDYDIPHIQLFYLLRQHVPLVYGTYPVANELLGRLMAGHRELSLIDFGMGNGQQLADLFEQQGRLGRLPKKMTVVGVDLNATDLAKAEENLTHAARKRRIDFEFVPVPRLVEDLDEADWAAFRALPGARIVNATFSLHHLLPRPDAPDLRDAFFARIAELEPVGVVLCEPNADLNIASPRQRLINMVAFFRSFFRHIDELDLPEADKKALKFAMWGREIQDILGNCEEGRCERYESIQSWVGRLRRVGFAPFTAMSGVERLAPREVSVTRNEGFVGLGIGTETVIGVAALCPGLWPTPPATHLPATERARRLSTIPPPSMMPLSRAPLHRAPERFDAETYIRLLLHVARVEGHIHERKRAFIEHQMHLLFIEPRTVRHVGGAKDLEKMAPPRVRRAVVRDCILLAHLDGDYSSTERTAVTKIAARLGIEQTEVEAMEASAIKYAPPLMEKAPSWLKETWILQAKRSDTT